jgi:hypothetical protein
MRAAMYSLDSNDSAVVGGLAVQIGFGMRGCETHLPEYLTHAVLAVAPFVPHHGIWIALVITVDAQYGAFL